MPLAPMQTAARRTHRAAERAGSRRDAPGVEVRDASVCPAWIGSRRSMPSSTTSMSPHSVCRSPGRAGSWRPRPAKTHTPVQRVVRPYGTHGGRTYVGEPSRCPTTSLSWVRARAIVVLVVGGGRGQCDDRCRILGFGCATCRYFDPAGDLTVAVRLHCLEGIICLPLSGMPARIENLWN